jgi:hypothetical protein
VSYAARLLFTSSGPLPSTSLTFHPLPTSILLLTVYKSHQRCSRILLAGLLLISVCALHVGCRNFRTMLTRTPQNIRRRPPESKNARKNRADSAHVSSSNNPKESGAIDSVSSGHHAAVGLQSLGRETTETTPISVDNTSPQRRGESSSAAIRNENIDGTAPTNFTVTSDEQTTKSPSLHSRRHDGHSSSRQSRAPKKQPQFHDVSNDSNPKTSSKSHQKQRLGIRYVILQRSCIAT